MDIKQQIAKEITCWLIDQYQIHKTKYSDEPYGKVDGRPMYEWVPVSEQEIVDLILSEKILDPILTRHQSVDVEKLAKELASEWQEARKRYHNMCANSDYPTDGGDEEQNEYIAGDFADVLTRHLSDSAERIVCDSCNDYIEAAPALCEHCMMMKDVRIKELEAERDQLKAYYRGALVPAEVFGPDDVCDKCHGWGFYAYPSTAVWTGGIGGQAITNGVCDVCWGSGQKSRKGADLRKLYAERKALKAENERLREALNKIGYEPIGDAESSAVKDLADCVDIARAALSKKDDKGGDHD